MEEEGFQAKIFDFVKHNFLVVGLLLAGVVFVGVGVAQMMGQKTATVEFEKGQAVEGVAAEEKSTKIKIDVEGEVKKPGVYVLPVDSRVEDAVNAAGGLSKNAERSALNLAQKISDGQKIYVPAIGETISQSVNVLSGGSDNGQTASGGLINVNSGTQEELESLTGIGPVTAGKIISNRPYSSLEELVDKKAIGQGTFDKIRAQISL